MVVEMRVAEFPERSEAGSFSVSEREGAYGRRFVEIIGVLPVGWLGSLSQGMAAAGIGIERGRATRVDRQRWEIQLELKTGLSGRAQKVDYLELASRRWARAPRPIVIDDYAIERYAERSALILDVKGVDCNGFLASLLERLTGILLFPAELEIETIGPHAVDRLCLQTLGGKEPPQEAASILATLLDSLRPEPRGASPRSAMRAPAWSNLEPDLDC